MLDMSNNVFSMVRENIGETVKIETNPRKIPGYLALVTALAIYLSCNGENPTPEQNSESKNYPSAVKAPFDPTQATAESNISEAEQ